MAQSLRLTGAGASFPFPLYSTWFQAYSQATPGIEIDYQSTGSGAGVKSFISRTVDFAASDSAMTDEQIAEVDGGVVILPMTAGEIVLAYNLPGVTELKLPREVYPLIFLGEVTSWNDPRIAAANPGVTLPDTPITAVRRSDASGTTFVFTNHLAAISEKFKGTVSAGTNPQWPGVSNLVAAPRNDGVTATVAQTPGAIGYIEWGYAKLTNTPAALLQNAAGNYVAPGGEGGPLALAGAEFKGDDLRGWVTDPAGAGSLSDHHLHLDAVLQEAGDRAGRGAAQPGRLGAGRWPEDGRAARLHLLAGRRAWSFRRVIGRGCRGSSATATAGRSTSIGRGSCCSPATVSARRGSPMRSASRSRRCGAGSSASRPKAWTGCCATRPGRLAGRPWPRPWSSGWCT